MVLEWLVVKINETAKSGNTDIKTGLRQEPALFSSITHATCEKNKFR